MFDELLKFEPVELAVFFVNKSDYPTTWPVLFF